MILLNDFLKRICQRTSECFSYIPVKVSNRFTDSIKAVAIQKGAIILGEFGCKGFNTYGSWKVIGGMNKNHPSKDELEKCVEFFDSLL